MQSAILAEDTLTEPWVKRNNFGFVFLEIEADFPGFYGQSRNNTEYSEAC
jgi:hypothetical protein